MNKEKRPGLLEQVTDPKHYLQKHNSIDCTKKQYLDFDQISRKAMSQAESLLRRHFPHGKKVGENYSMLNPTRHDESRGSFSINLTTGLWSDFATSDGGKDIISFFAYVGNTSYYDAAVMLAEDLGTGVASCIKLSTNNRQISKKKYSSENVWATIMPVPLDAPSPPKAHYSLGTFASVWEYLDSENALLGLVCRIDRQDGKKDIIPLTYCRSSSGQMEWRYQAFPAPRPLYFSRNQTYSHELPLLFVEGEKACDAAATLFTYAYMCLSWPGGCKAVDKANLGIMNGKDILIWPDADVSGLLAAVSLVYDAIKNSARSIRIILPPEPAFNGWDLADAVSAGWDSKRALAWVNNNTATPDFFATTILDTYVFTDVEREKIEGLLGHSNETNKSASEISQQDGASAITIDSQWDLAKKMFPKIDFPWEILPGELVDVFKGLAKSCATSPNPIPTTAIAILTSLVGSTIRVVPKPNWSEPLVYFVVNIQESGEGKSPYSQLLCSYIYEIQDAAENKYKEEMEAWTAQKSQEKGPMPNQPRSFFATSTTIEALSTANIAHGGLLCNFDEISSFVSSQNQYKKNGDDREG